MAQRCALAEVLQIRLPGIPVGYIVDNIGA